MAVVKTKPTSPGRRFVVQVTSKELHKGAPYEPLVAKKSKTGGRNNKGRITTRHRGGGHKQRYRVIDFKLTRMPCLAWSSAWNTIRTVLRTSH
jgi:large subunit ribosomal protein L2